MKRIIGLFIILLCLCSAKAQQTEVRYLSGTGPDNTVKWDFWCSSGMNSQKWSKIEVPSCWEQQGFGGYTYGRYYIYKERENEKQYDAYREHDFCDEYGIYRHHFDVPDTWKGKQISIVFEGVMTDAEVKINDVIVGPTHQGAFYRFSYDITDKLKFGKKNSMEVTVRKQSADKSVNAAERRADWWLFGGIYRPVYLMAKPRTQIDHIAVDARADGTLRTDVYLKNISKGQQVELSLMSCDSQLSIGRQVCGLSTGEKQTLTTHWENIKTWDPEHPNLYRLTMRLLSTTGDVVHEITERIGFRTIEFRPEDGIYLNGTRLLVKGTNRHCFDSETGRTISRELSLKDALLIKQMNMNAVRSHYPPDSHFLEVCDSIGLLYLNELCGWQNSYSTEIAEKLLPEMMFRDVNHPCIFIWANGNEGGWNTAIDNRFANYDPQKRHVIHPWADFNGLDTRHYPNSTDNMYRLERGHKVFMMTEFLHGLYDRGQGAGLKGLWSKFKANPLFAGGFLWAYVDEAIRRTDTGQMDTYGPNAPDGIVGANREKEGSFYTVREVWSPIQINPFKITSSFKGDFYVANDYLFSNLNECRMKWKVMRLPIPQASDSPICLAEGSVLLPAIQPGEKGTAHFDLPEKFFNGDVLELEAYSAAGDTVCNWAFPIKNNRKYFAEYRHLQPTATTTARYQADDNSVTLIANGVAATFNKANGNLVEVKNGSKVIPLSNGPLPVGMKMLFSSANLKMQGDTAIYTVKYKGAADSIVWRMTPDGLLGMDALVLNYRADNKFDGAYFDRPVHNLGFSFSFPEKNVSGIRWLGKGPYRVWKNRIEGTNYGIWQKDYNNTVTGEYYHPLVYPEFKGYHAGLYWAILQSQTTPMTVYSETDGIFFRVFTPEEQRDRESRGISVKEYPAGDISFLFEIPAVNSQGTGGEASYIKINKGDEGFRMKLWFQF